MLLIQLLIRSVPVLHFKKIPRFHYPMSHLNGSKNLHGEICPKISHFTFSTGHMFIVLKRKLGA